MDSRIETVGKPLLYIILFLAVSTLCSCGSHSQSDTGPVLLAYHVDGDTLLARNSPTFVVERANDDWNRIATPVVKKENQKAKVTLDSSRATIYTEIRHWTGSKDRYTNLIYRVHFPETPFRLIPFNLTAGKNVGLLVIITLNSRQQPLLVTTVHTCGCYLAFLPTSYLDRQSWPPSWSADRQRVYGEILPGLLQLEHNFAKTPLILKIRESTHRVKEVRLLLEEELERQPAQLLPVETLTALEGPDGSTHSFYETEGKRKDYVVDSQKFWERLFISWWALDWRVGEDKRLGADTSDGIVFYTSLKPWARAESDLRDFARFLDYWGWKL